MNIRNIIKDRFTRWSKHLRKHNATPIITIGVSHGTNSGQLVLCTTEETTNEQVIIILSKTIGSLQENIAQQN